MLGRDKYLPNQLSDIGSRLVYSNGIVLLTILAAILLVVFEGSVSNLIPLYCVGVFISFTLSQSGMVIHWYRVKGKNWMRSAVINGMGAFFTVAALIVIAATKFTQGAWFILLLVPILLYLFSRVHKHYENVAQELSLQEHFTPTPAPRIPRQHMVIVPVPGIQKVVLEALDYAKAISSDVRAIYVDLYGAESVTEISKKWKEHVSDVPLTILPSPERHVVGAVLKYVDEMQADGEILVTVVIPEFLQGRWSGHLLHRQMASTLKQALLNRSHVPVVSVAHQLSAHPQKYLSEKMSLPVGQIHPR
jgi:Amino acid permease